ncbi:MAG TPA: hypothetical protein VFC01_16275 [Mycobacterium sp.]|nr:hypothetical protein [Mycobacterium sp.]
MTPTGVTFVAFTTLRAPGSLGTTSAAASVVVTVQDTPSAPRC